MSKITTDLSSLPTNEATQSVQQASNEFTNFMSAPVRKLDADEYMANDLDGVTESLTGSGNLNFLMMQAGQTDEAMGTANPFDMVGGGDGFGPSSLYNGPQNYAGNGGAGNDTAMDRPFEMPNGLGSIDDIGGGNGNSNGTLGGLGASAAASNSTSATPFSDTTGNSSSYTSTGTNGNNGNNGTSGTSGTSGTNGTNGNGTNGTNGIDGTPGGNTFITENTFIDLGDTYEFIDNITNEYTDFLTELTENTFSTVNNIINNFFEEFPFDLGPVGIDLHAVVDDLTELDLGIISGDQIISVLNEVVDLSPVMTPVQDLVGDLLTDLHVTAILDPFQYDASPNDYDLHVGTGLDILGLQIPDIGLDVPLDPIEGLLGDLDVSVDLAQMLDLSDGLLDLPFIPAGPADTDLALAGLENIIATDGVSNLVETIVNPVEDLVGDLDIGAGLGIDLLGLGNTNDASVDNDISIPLDIAFIDSPILNDGIEIGLDPIENIIGDVDIDLGVAGNLLGNVAPGIFDAEAGGLGAGSPLAGLGDQLSAGVDQLLPLGNSGDTDLALGTNIDALDNDLLNDGLNLILDPVENLVGDVDIAGNLGVDLLGLGQTDNNGADMDVVVPIDLGIVNSPLLADGLNVSLDPVEDLTGDIDLDLDVAADILGNNAGPLVDAFDGGTGGADVLSQLGDGLGYNVDQILPVLGPQTGAGSGIDSMLDLGSNLGLGNDLDLTQGTLGGDNLGGINDWFNIIDQTLDTALDIVNSMPENTGGLDLGAITSGGGDSLSDVTSGIGSWTETVLPDAGSILGGGLASDPIAMIPDPITPIPIISLPVVPVVPSIPVVGGLFGGGGHHHGGLFG